MNSNEWIALKLLTLIIMKIIFELFFLVGILHYIKNIMHK